MNENENPRITDAERPKKYKHSEISGAFNPLKPTETWSIAGRYSDLSAQWEAGVEVFGASIQKSIAGAWEGTAAESAKDAITRYTKAAQDLTTPLTNLSTRVWDAAQAIVDTNGNLPDPVEEKSWWHKDSWPWVGTNRDGVIEDQQEEAQAVMKNYYVDRFMSLDGQIPTFPQPVDPTKPLDISGSPAIVDGGGNPSNGRGNSTGGEDTTSRGDSPQGSGTGEQPGAEPTSNDETTPSTTDSSTTPSTVTPTSTQPDPSKLTTNTSTTPASTVPSGTPTGTLGTPSGSPGTGAPNSATPSPGRTVSGTPAGATPAAATAGTAAAASRGGTGMSGMGGMGAGRGQSDDKESDHKIPDYLINMTNTDELLGEAPKTVPGGVIGDNPDD